MNARRDSSDGPGAGLFGGRVLLIGAVVFAAAATGLLVLTDQEKWLRLGIVAALWAALTGGFLAARYRRQLADQRETVAERQQIYELELEREIAARREHELTVEAEAKRKVEESSRDDLAELRTELQNMRQTLESLLGGEFLVERYALRAESTRMRSLPEDRSIAMRRDVKHLPAAQVVREAETEMIERVIETHQKPRRETPAPRQEPRVPDSRPPSVPRGPERPAARPERPTPEPVKPTPQPAPRAPHPAEVSDRWFVPDGLADATPQRSEQPRRQEPQRPADPAPRRPAAAAAWDAGEQEWGPSWEKKQNPAAHDTGTHFGGRAEETSWLAQYNAPKPAAEPTFGSRAYVPQARPEAQPRPAPQPRVDPQPSQRNMPPAQPSMPNMPPAQPSLRNMPPAQPSLRNMPPAQPSLRNIPPAQPSLPNMPPAQPSLRNMPPAQPSLRNIPPAQPAGQHRGEPEEEAGGGRRRRAEGQPSWQETVGHRAEQASGSHASGRSVSELLADNGHNTSPRRRRRRED